jgi:hypothetical protein
MSYWRLKPTPFVDAGVRAIALREGRSISNTLHKLVTEALQGRERRRAELERIKSVAAKAAAAPLSSSSTAFVARVGEAH